MGVKENRFQYSGCNVGNWCAGMQRASGRVEVPNTRNLISSPSYTHSNNIILKFRSSVPGRVLSVRCMSEFQSVVFLMSPCVCECLHVRWCSRCSECGASGRRLQTIAADTLSTLTAVSPAQRDHECCGVTPMETRRRSISGKTNWSVDGPDETLQYYLPSNQQDIYLFLLF